ncbi:MAG TPA: HD domain-containing phosphohydrolase [Candidatus Polarisedimenticolia bacterium]
MTANASKTASEQSRRPKHKIVYWFLVVMIAMALVPLGISAYKLIDIGREALVTSQQEVQLQVATSTARQLNAAVEGLRGQMARLAEGIAVLAKNPAGQAVPAGARPAGMGQGLIERFLGPDLLLLRYVPRAGAPLEARQTGFPTPRPVEAAIGAATRSALEGNAYVGNPVQVPVGDDATRAVLVVGVPVGDGRPAQGALIGLVDFATYWDPLVGGRRAAYIIYALDSGGVLFASQDDEGLLKRIDYRTFGVVQECRGNRGRSALTTEFSLVSDGRRTDYLASCDTTQQGWGIFVQLEKKQAYASVNQMIQTTLIWAGLATLLALVLAYLLASNVTRPIKTLVAGTEAFARGELDHRVVVRSRNELGTLAEMFNTMAQEIQGYIQRLAAAAQQNNELFMGTIKALAEAIDEKDPYTRGHSERVNRYAVLLAKQLGMTKKELREVHIASLFHDIGKIGIEDKILRKPAVLTDEEYTTMKAHPEKGAQMLSKIKAMKDIIPGMRFHHERWDGTGYPLKLKAEQIPMAARIVSVADAFDAMTTNRPYQKAMSFDKAIARLFELSDRAFDRRVVTAFAESYKAGAFKEPRHEQEEQ